MEALLVLPNSVGDISPHVLAFLDKHFNTPTDLSTALSLSTQLQKDCGDLDRNLTLLHRHLSSLITQWVSRSNSIKSSFHQLNCNFTKFFSYSSPEVGSKNIGKILGEELPMLATEMRRIDLVRHYAETTLRLEALVGDLEDAVLSVMNQNKQNMISVNHPKASSLTDFRWKQEKVHQAVIAMTDIEDVLLSIAKFQLKWSHLVKSVDARVDKAFVALRMQSLADHRAILASLGWPPPLLVYEYEVREGSEIPNPLVSLHGDNKVRYYQSFSALCALQNFLAQRAERQPDVVSNVKDCLWTIDELVSPIASKTEHHFSKWIDQPKYIFALVYKITKDVVGGVDDVLQPLIDKARLVGYSSKEAWVSAMAKIVLAFLTKQVFSVLAKRYKVKNAKAEVIYSWLNLVDLIIAFDRRMWLLANLGTADNAGEPVGFDGFSKGISCLSIFCDHPDWLRIWAKIELKDALIKLREELENERSWMINNKTEVYTVKAAESFILSSREDHKAPIVTEVVVKITQAMMQRCQTLPSILPRAQFIRLSAAKFLWHFFNILLQRCEEVELIVGFVEDDALMRLCGSINAARYCESTLRVWSEDIDFLEMRIAEDVPKAEVRDVLDDSFCFFWEELKFLMKLETDWTVELMAIILRQFDSLSWKYIQYIEAFSFEQEGFGENLVLGADEVALSQNFVEALEALGNMLHLLKASLNSKDFLDLWRSVADGLDRFIFGSPIMSVARFSNWWIRQVLTDMQALFLVFHPFCARPDAFFPCIRDSVKLFEMDLKDVKHLLSVLSKVVNRNEHLRLHGILYISPDQAEKILRGRT